MVNRARRNQYTSLKRVTREKPKGVFSRERAGESLKKLARQDDKSALISVVLID